MSAKSRFLLLITSLLLLFPAAWAQAQGEPTPTANAPTNVGLLYFIASTIPNQNEVTLEWETATEVGTAGFIIKRRTGTTGDFDELENIGFIDAEGDSAIGAWYQAVDDSSVTGQAYTYRLFEVENNNAEIPLEDVTITAGALPTPTPTATATATPSPSPTATPQTVLPPPGGSNPTATPPNQPTNTPTPPAATPSPTARATATSTPATTGGATATATPRPTLTATSASTGNSGSSGSSTTPGQTGSQATGSQPTGSQTAGSPAATPTGSQATPTSTPGSSGSVSALAQSDPDSAASEQQTTTDTERSADGPEPIPPPTGNDFSAPDKEAAAGESNPALPVIGSDVHPESDDTAPAQRDNAQPGTPFGSLLLLWGGFILALLIFIASVIGSIYLFTRKRE